MAGTLTFAVLLMCSYIISADPGCNVVLSSHYDFIVVGAGTSGSVLAARLSEKDDVKVLVLEAGHWADEVAEKHLIDTPGLSHSLMGSEVDWGYKTERQKHCCEAFNERKLPISRGKVVGGTSSIDNMNHIRGSRYVYDKWEAMGAEGWNFTSIRKYFEKSESFQVPHANFTGKRGFCGPMPVTNGTKPVFARYSVLEDAINEMRWPVIECNGDNELGLCESQTTIKYGSRVSTGSAYLKRVLGRKNIDILTGAHVTEITFFNETSNIVRGVKFNFEGGNYSINATKEVLLSAGPIETPKLLMLSGIGPKAHLQTFKINVKADLPVGDNLQDKFVVPVRVYIDAKTYNPNKPLDNVERWRDFIYYRKGELGDGLLDAIMQLQTMPQDPSRLYPDLQVSILNMLFDHNDMLLRRMNIKTDFATGWYGTNTHSGKFGLTFLVGLIHSKSRGTVRLKSTDPLDMPKIDPKYLTNADDLNELGKGAHFIGVVTDNMSGGDLDDMYGPCAHHQINSNEYWQCYAKVFGYSESQIVGTARMGNENDTSTVVDPKLRVKGIKRLRVVDASIMPMAVGYTRATEILIGEKAADMIKKELEELEKEEMAAKNASKAANSTSTDDESMLMHLLQKILNESSSSNNTAGGTTSSTTTGSNRIRILISNSLQSRGRPNQSLVGNTGSNTVSGNWNPPGNAATGNVNNWGNVAGNTAGTSGSMNARGNTATGSFGRAGNQGWNLNQRPVNNVNNGVNSFTNVRSQSIRFNQNGGQNRATPGQIQNLRGTTFNSQTIPQQQQSLSQSGQAIGNRLSNLPRATNTIPRFPSRFSAPAVNPGGTSGRATSSWGTGRVLPPQPFGSLI